MDIKKLAVGKNPPEEVNVFIEIPKDSNIKYELDKDTGIIFVDRFLHTAMNFPFNYGFIANTLADDGDPLDVIVLGDQSVAPGTVIPSRVIGFLEMEDEAGNDTKIVAVPDKKIDPLFGEYSDISDVPEATKNKIKHFFENYKTLEKDKWVKIKNWKGKKEALVEVEKAIK
ncbi:MAG TPA: inorganic diphosphatase [Patescibacteria group bacterium]|nr:inorganic diphosphatase [Patescibacteria group bacterium]